MKDSPVGWTNGTGGTHETYGIAGTDGPSGFEHEHKADCMIITQ